MVGKTTLACTILISNLVVRTTEFHYNAMLATDLFLQKVNSTFFFEFILRVFPESY